MAWLDSQVESYRNATPQDDTMRALVVRNFARFLGPDAQRRTGLELGCSNGHMTQRWSELVGELDVVDGSQRFLEEVRAKGLRNVHFHHALFEDFLPPRQYDFIFACYILPSLDEPRAVLERARRWLAPGGLLYAVVPNARSLSRQLAVHVGALQSMYALSKNDGNHGISRVYDLGALRREVQGAGLDPMAQGGIMLKMLADFQMDRMYQAGILTPELVDGLYALGLEYPDLCGSIFVVARNPV
jgi:SAM-dependent methyltransferase